MTLSKNIECRERRSCPEIVELASSFRADIHKYVLLRFGNADLAEDVTQETFIRFMEVDEPSKIENPRGYLLRIAANLCIDHLRKNKVQFIDAETAVDNGNLLGNQTSPEDILLGSELEKRLFRALSSMPQKLKIVFLLHRYDGKTTMEVANQLGISRRMAQKNLAKAMNYLHKRLQN